MAATPASTPAPFDSAALVARWPILLGVAALAIPTFQTLGSQVWSSEAGAHGPIILATGGWLLWRELPSLRAHARPASPWLLGLGLAMTLALYIFGRAFDFISLETLGLYGVGIALLYSSYGLWSLLRNWFPLFYLGFCVPPPVWLIDQLTGPLKQFVSWAATEPLYLVGLPVSREGVTIFIGSYQLLVEDACSGMNSLVGLSAISLFYIYLLRGSSLRYSLLLALFIIPIAVIGNILRVVTLILLTHYFGDAVAQGFLHFAAGIFLFIVDLLLVFALDQFLAKTLPKSWRPA